MEFAEALYAAITEVADGKVAEIEIEHTYVDDEAEITLRFSIRKEPWKSPTAPADFIE